MKENFAKDKEDLIRHWTEDRIITDKNVLEAFREISRENFVPERHLGEAYGDYPLPIGFEQSISQPTTVLLMLSYLDVSPEHKVLEIGAGSGYSAALLSRLCKVVYTVERIKELCNIAEKNLYNAKIGNVEIIHGDGSNGYKKEAPYDRIIVTAAVPQIPQDLIDQLKTGGIIVAPVGSLYEQEMTKLTKTETGFKVKELGAFRFVPLKGKHGF